MVGAGLGSATLLSAEARPANVATSATHAVGVDATMVWHAPSRPCPDCFSYARMDEVSRAGSASILCAASAQAICASISHRFVKLKRAAPASLCSVAFALQVWSAASALLMTKPQSMKTIARGCIRELNRNKAGNPYDRLASFCDMLAELTDVGFLSHASARL